MASMAQRVFLTFGVLDSLGSAVEAKPYALNLKPFLREVGLCFQGVPTCSGSEEAVWV